MKITQENYVNTAEKVMRDICQPDNPKYKKYLSTSQIRNLLAMISDIYNNVRRTRSEKLDIDVISDIQYLKLHIVYEAGRQNTVKEFVEKADLLNQIDTINNSKAQFMLFSHYMEALVAYRKFYGGKDE